VSAGDVKNGKWCVKMNKPPNPGSDEAIKLGCICPIADNNNGKGLEINGQIVFWHTYGCEVHKEIIEMEEE